jgi:hypothetical protein
MKLSIAREKPRRRRGRRLNELQRPKKENVDFETGQGKPANILDCLR